MPVLAQEPQEPAHLQVMVSLRVRLMESQELGEQLEFLLEAVLSPHLHQQNPQQLGVQLGSLPEAVVFPESYHQELAHFRV